MEEKVKRVRKPKTSQIPYAIGLTIALAAFTYYLYGMQPTIAVALLFGLAFGYILQRSRFCFTAAFRDPWISGSTSLTRAVLLAILIATIGFAVIMYKGFLAGGEIPGIGMIKPIGIPLVLGGIIFGTGMVIAGGCASGTLMRVGEGFTMQIIALFFFVMGSLWGVHDMPFWDKFNENAPSVFLPDVFGWAGGLVVQILIIAVVYFIAIAWQKKKMGSSE